MAGITMIAEATATLELNKTFNELLELNDGTLLYNK